MIRRFASDLSVFTLGGFLAVTSQAWSSGTVQWMAFIVGVLALVAGVAGAVDTARGERHRAVDALTAVIGAWAIVMSFAFSGGDLIDLSLYTGIAFAVLGAAGLIVHELHTERVVHALEVRESSTSTVGQRETTLSR
jgi:hypothetical protein